MKNRSIAETIRSAIESWIESGRLLPGQTIDERTLAAEFSVSRTPVRQAIQQLQGEGILKVLPRVGAMVPELGLRDLLTIFEFLAELEGTAARFAARRIARDRLPALRSAAEACSDAAARGDSMDYLARNKAFHELIYAAAGNTLLETEIRRLRKRRYAYELNRFDRPNGMMRSAAEHAELVAVIADGHAERAYQLARDHILIGADDLMDYVSTLPSAASTASAG